MFSVRTGFETSVVLLFIFLCKSKVVIVGDITVSLWSSKIMCDKRLKLPHVLAFVGRRQLFLQSTPIGRGAIQDDLSVSPLMFTDAADNTSCSK